MNPSILRPVMLGGLLAIAATGCERPPTDMIQRGYRGLAMDQVYNPRQRGAPGQSDDRFCWAAGLERLP